jgi:ABC-type molybdate transport system substrate-binding protein
MRKMQRVKFAGPAFAAGVLLVLCGNAQAAELKVLAPLPAAINSIVMFTAGVSAVSPNQQAARELIKLMKSPEAKAII